MRTVWIIPCLNEELTIRRVVRACFEALPQAEIFVIDNASTDRTAREAKLAGAEVLYCAETGKGRALRLAFETIHADYYLMIDGDDTYPADEASRLLGLAITQKQDMVMGARLELGAKEAFRPLHYAGNLFFSSLTRLLFRHPVQDLLTGFRVFSRHLVETLELTSTGFEIETELTLMTLKHRLAMSEVQIPYVERPPESRSKLKTFRDGWKILRAMWRIYRAPIAPAKIPTKRAA